MNSLINVNNILEAWLVECCDLKCLSWERGSLHHFFKGRVRGFVVSLREADKLTSLIPFD